ncbi:hypothetical protein SAMN04487950_3718 [Halogranum rubrum]|uniref:Uncharacterized protein n=2 Tax=Halogranum rubrum TaxID=553466 RepID=A0A1I4HH16_9EURY|nr:hypothetical protein SAMN04487950_3718 [Halogranum rubrum]
MRRQRMNEDAVDRRDGERHTTTGPARETPLVGFELTLARDKPVECRLFLIDTTGTVSEGAWITATEGAFVDLDVMQ